MKIPSNTAAWQPEPGAPLEVKPAPYTSPGENEIVIKNAAVAVNPVDWIRGLAGIRAKWDTMQSYVKKVALNFMM